MARGLPTGGQGSKVYVLCAEPKEHKHFRPGTRPGGSGTRPGGSGARPGGSGARPGGSVTGVTEKLFMCKCLCAFSGPYKRGGNNQIFIWQGVFHFSRSSVQVDFQDWGEVSLSLKTSCRRP